MPAFPHGEMLFVKHTVSTFWEARRINCKDVAVYSKFSILYSYKINSFYNHYLTKYVDDWEASLSKTGIQQISVNV